MVLDIHIVVWSPSSYNDSVSYAGKYARSTSGLDLHFTSFPNLISPVDINVKISREISSAEHGEIILVKNLHSFNAASRVALGR